MYISPCRFKIAFSSMCHHVHTSPRLVVKTFVLDEFVVHQRKLHVTKVKCNDFTRAFFRNSLILHTE